MLLKIVCNREMERCPFGPPRWLVVSAMLCTMLSDKCFSLFLFSPSSFRLKYCIQDWRWNLCRSAPHLRIIQQLSLSLQSNEQDGEALSINHQNKHTFQASTILIARVNYMDTKDFALEWVSPTLLDQSSLITFFQTRLSAEVKIYTYIYTCLKQCPLQARRPEDATKPAMLLCKFNMPKIKRTVLMMTNIL